MLGKNEKREEILALVKRVREGDEKAFEDLYNATWSSVYYTAYRYLNDFSIAEDVTQEVFLIVNKEIGKLRNEESFIIWINRISANRCKKLLKSMYNNKLVSIEEVDERIFSKPDDFLPEDIITNKETQNEILKLVMQLSEEQRKAVLLYYYGHLSTTEIAKILGTTKHAIHIKLSRARDFIKKRMGHIGFAFSEPVISRLLIREAESLCTPEIKEHIMEKITLSAGVGAVSSEALLQYTASELLRNMGICLSIVTMVAVGASLYQYSENSPKQTTTEQIETITTEISSTPEVNEILTLEDMVGSKDAKTIRGFVIAVNENCNEELMEIVYRHKLEPLGIYVDLNRPKDDSYMMYELIKEDKRLLICERYNPIEVRWSAVYKLINIADGIPESNDYIFWYEQAENAISVNIENIK